MEKTTLLVKKTKKGKLNVRLEFASGNGMPFPRKPLQDLSLDNCAVLVKRKKGQPVLITKEDGTVLFQEDQKSANPPGLIQDHVRHVRNPASAPYNFVPLNKKVVPAPDTAVCDHNRYHSGLLSGWIELDIITRTPLYVRSTLTEEEVREGKESNNKNNDKPVFFSPAGRFSIPGSSLRGMTRTLVEMTSFGKLYFVDNNKTLYYRGLADRSNLRSEYQRRMSAYDPKAKKAQYTCLAGVLYKSQKKERGEHYYIHYSGKFNEHYHQIPKPEAKERIRKNRQINDNYEEFHYYTFDDGYIVVSGDMPNKKRNWWIDKPDSNAEKIEIPKQDVQSYLEDDTRHKVDDDTRHNNILNLIKLARKEGKKGVPCFFIRWKDKENNQRVSFGHTAMFRLAYDKTIGDHIPEQLQAEESTDFAETIFGTTERAGKVFFEDALLKGDAEKQKLSAGTPHILSTPKPTTFQHYLVQDSDNIKQLHHYNSYSAIRGHKMYWHKSGKHWQQEDKNEVKNHTTQYTTKIEPVKKDTRFRGKIRFENLCQEELGALLFALQLPEGCAHKLGMGKPLGLGSIQVTPTLYLTDRQQQRYTQLFSEWDGSHSAEPVEQVDLYRQRFSQYVLKQLNETDKESLWETERLKELLIMLHQQTGFKLEASGKTRYMNITGKNEFLFRPVLPKPSDLSTNSDVDFRINLKNEHEQARTPSPLHRKIDKSRPLACEKSIIPERSIIDTEMAQRRQQMYEVKNNLRGDSRIRINASNGACIDTSGMVLKDLFSRLLLDRNEHEQKLIKHIELSGFLGKYNVVWEPFEDVNVLVGINGKGKTTLLDIIDGTLTGKFDISKHKIPREVTITFDNGKNIHFKDGKFSNNYKPFLNIDYISTFDKKNKNIIEEEISLDTFIDTELTKNLNQKFASFDRELNNRLVNLNNTNSAQKLKDSLKEEVDFFFSDTEKEILFYCKYQYHDSSINDEIPNDHKVFLKSPLYDTDFNNIFASKNDCMMTLEKYFHKYNSKLFIKYKELIRKMISDNVHCVIKHQDGLVIDPSYLSAGEKQFLIIVLTVLLQQRRPWILLMDEPEISLHPDWQANLITMIRKLNPKAQVIISTHSPALVMDHWFGQLVDFETVIRKRKNHV